MRTPGIAAEPLRDELATRGELRDHRVQRLLRSLEGGDSSALNERRNTGVIVEREQRESRRERRGDEAEAKPPARHRVGL
jgi:hypothetical protein